MDIFTTQLTRVVPVPIKPVRIKVKALLKDAANTKLSHDPDHLENHEYYFAKEDEQYHSCQQEAKQHSFKEQHAQQKTDIGELEFNDDELAAKKSIALEALDKETNQTNNKPKHLDLYA
ncbi:MAG: hypothetical protein ACI9U5_001402 [Colwellia sp.]|jgi:hypothetical protein